MRFDKWAKPSLDVESQTLPSVSDLPSDSVDDATDPVRVSVITLASLGINAKEMADITGTEESALSKYAKDISAASALANARVARTAYRLAVSGESPKSTFTWLKARAGWKEDGININNNLMISWPLPPSPREIQQVQIVKNDKTDTGE